MTERYTKWKFYLCIIPVFLLAVIESIGSLASLVREKILEWCLKPYAEGQAEYKTEDTETRADTESFVRMNAEERLSWLGRISWKARHISVLFPKTYQMPVFILILIATFLITMFGTDALVESLLDIKPK